MNKFKNLVPTKAIAVRDGQQARIESEKLVPGDIVRIRGGDKIPADIRLIDCSSMQVDTVRRIRLSFTGR